MVSRLIVILGAVLGALGHAKLTQSQQFRSNRTVFDVVSTAVMATLLIPLGLDGKVMTLLGMQGWMPPITDLPYEAQFGTMLMGGYLFSSALPNLIILANLFLKRWGLEIPLPETGVLTVEKPPLAEPTPAGIKAQGQAIVAKVEQVIEKERVTALAKASEVETRA